MHVAQSASAGRRAPGQGQRVAAPRPLPRAAQGVVVDPARSERGGRALRAEPTGHALVINLVGVTEGIALIGVKARGQDIRRLSTGFVVVANDLDMFGALPALFRVAAGDEEEAAFHPLVDKLP